MIPEFRAWDAVEQKMVRVTRLNWEYPSGLEVNGSNIVGFIESVMMSIGKKDKNRVEIYANDYVRYMSGNEGYYFEGVVELLHHYAFDGVAVKVNMDKPYNYWARSMMTIDDKEYVYDLPDGVEIVGNVHENPELLEATK